MDKKRYNKALGGLNTEQRKAVETIHGPVMVVAGPGTGKTQILSMRIAYILAETDTTPESILALTFTESGTVSIRKRLLELIGKSAYDVNVHTFHAFANSIIQTYPDNFPRIIGGTQCEPIDQIEIIQNIIENSSFEYLKPFGSQFYYVRPIISVLQDLKREGYTPDKFEQLLKKQVRDFSEIEDLYHEKGKYKGQMKGAYATIESKIKKNHELLRVYRAYEEEKANRGLYDYDDMILEVTSALETDNDFLLMLQEKYLYILADEHQDANRSQNRLLELLSSFHEDPNIFVVGDDKQAIYRFQGASLENFLYFKDRYSNAIIIELEDNYRSTQHILDTAANLISNNPTLSNKKLQARSEADTKTTKIVQAATPLSEAQFVASSIKDLIDQGETPEGIAVLYRNNHHAEVIRKELLRENIPYSLHGAAAESPHIITEQFLDVLAAIADPTEESVLSQILFYSFFNLELPSIFSVLKSTRERKQTLVEFAVAEPDDAAAKIINLIMELHQKSKNATLRDLFDQTLTQTNLLEAIMKDTDSDRALTELRSLFDLVKKPERDGTNLRLDDYLARINRAKEYGISIFSPSNHKRSGVQLMTVHRSKGLEFDAVFVVGATESNWGGRKNSEYFYLPELKSLKINEAQSLKEDERRLFYVALTRAKEMLFVSYYLKNDEGREQIESQFITELGEEVEMIEFYNEEKALDLTKSARSVATLLDEEVISSYFFSRGLNATAINKYLRCSWDYFFTSLLRVPQTYSTSALFGTAMHSALQKYFSRRIESESAAQNEAKLILREKLFHGKLDEAEAERFYKRGEAALDGYFKTYGSLPPVKSELERTIRMSFELEGESIGLTGNLDRVEALSSGKYIVTDFKTGKPKSRNDLEGKTKNSNGNYKRQLVFYSLLLEGVGQKMEAGIIDFVEPNSRGIYKQEKFDITSEEREELETTIRSISKEILSLSFVDKGCQEKTCEWCRLAGFLETRN